MSDVLKVISVKKTQQNSCCDWCCNTIRVYEPSVVVMSIEEGKLKSDRFHDGCYEVFHEAESRNYESFLLNK